MPEFDANSKPYESTQQLSAPLPEESGSGLHARSNSSIRDVLVSRVSQLPSAFIT
jgi:hypothetical protein